MNSVIDAIKKRRSVRAYEPAPISKDMIDVLIEAGNEAPSAMNSQPWRFVVVQDPEAKKKMLRAALPNAKKILDLVKDADPERHAAIMKRLEEQEDPIYYSAPVIIFVIGSGRYADHSCPLACENIMLAAHSLGLGSCWVGFGSMVTDAPEIVSLLDLQPEEKIYGPILVGHPKEYPGRPPKKSPVTKWV
jgi:nitroreductase